MAKYRCERCQTEFEVSTDQISLPVFERHFCMYLPQGQFSVAKRIDPDPWSDLVYILVRIHQGNV